jgi:hypothetical protein
MFKVQTWFRDQFWAWCQKNNIICEYMGTNSTVDNVNWIDTDTWYIGNEKDRTLAILRWV